MDRQRLERCLETVAAFRASGVKAKEWAPANGVALLELQSWCAHARRWQARLDEADGVAPGGVAGVGGAAAPRGLWRRGWQARRGWRRRWRPAFGWSWARALGGLSCTGR